MSVKSVRNVKVSVRSVRNVKCVRNVRSEE